jgi:ABC-2 type transport system permease protein
MRALLQKELLMFFKTPIGYIYLAISLFMSGLLFVAVNLGTGNGDFTIVLNTLQLMLLLTSPLLTMRLMTEERKNKTDQLLLTSPLTPFSLVLAKALASWLIFMLTCVAFIPYLLIIASLGSTDWPKVYGGILGYILLGSAYIAVGLYISSLTENQMTAAIFTFVTLFIFWIVDVLYSTLPNNNIVGLTSAVALLIAITIWLYKQTHHLRLSMIIFSLGVLALGIIVVWHADWIKNWLSQSLAWISLPRRYSRMLSGVLRISDVVYLLGFTDCFLYLSIWKIEKRRWSED